MDRFKLNFEKMNGLLPVVIQDYDNSEVLMVGFMNEDAWKHTLKTGKVHYWSRKKKRLWMKGEQSGNFQIVKEIYADNDLDSLLIKVNQIGGAVEDGYRSCFFYVKNGKGWVNVGKKVFDPKKVYKKYSETIRIGIPKGSLYAMTLLLLQRAGLQLDLRGEGAFAPTVRNRSDLQLVLLRAQEIPRMVQEGRIDLGLTGSDLIQETGANVTDLGDLGYNESGLGKIFWVLAVPKKKVATYRNIKNFDGKRIFTELPNIVQTYFADHKVHVEIERSVGATECKAALIADAIVDLCETGKSLVENGLIPLRSICTSAVHLWACNESLGYGWKRRKIEELAVAFKKSSKTLPKNHKRLIKLPS